MALRRATKVLLCVHAAVASHEDASCPSHRGQGCAACVAHVDGRPGRWHGSPCVHTSEPEGTGKSKSDCMPASWWEAAKHPAVTCVGNATGCAKSCGSAPPAPSPAPPPPPLGECTSDLDCSLNGACEAGKCRCALPWSGSRCGELQFAAKSPATGRDLYNAADLAHNTWYDFNFNLLLTVVH